MEGMDPGMEGMGPMMDPGMPMEGMGPNGRNDGRECPMMEGEGNGMEGEVEGFMGAMWNGVFIIQANKLLMMQHC